MWFAMKMWNWLQDGQSDRQPLLFISISYFPIKFHAEISKTWESYSWVKIDGDIDDFDRRCKNVGSI